MSLIYFIAGYPRLSSATSNTSIPQTFCVFMPTSMLRISASTRIGLYMSIQWVSVINIRRKEHVK